MNAHKAALRLIEEGTLTREEILALLKTDSEDALLRREARKKADAVFGKTIYLRGLIEISSFCTRDCYYCGLRHSNDKAARYRLSPAEILSAAEAGYEKGFRTIVLQGGEDAWFTAERVAAIVSAIKEKCPLAAITLSIGERSRSTYALWKKAGADRYLLRHETANAAHYAALHPPYMKAASRQKCLYDLKSLGYQVGAGFMVGSPGQTMAHIAEDLLFLQAFRPHMIGIGPFIPQSDTPFGKEKAGSLSLTVKLLSIVRLMHPRVLLPATTALATLSKSGREEGILAGANVVMPNLSPASVRGQYAIYDKKAFESLEDVCRKIADIGYEVVNVRGDYNEI